MKKIIGIIVFAIGASAIIGYIQGIISLYAWCQTPMAINTAIAFSLTGLGFIFED